LLHEEKRHRFAKKIDGRTCRLVAIPGAVKKCIAFPLFKKMLETLETSKPPNDINDLSGFQSFCGLETLETATELFENAVSRVSVDWKPFSRVLKPANALIVKRIYELVSKFP